jgi:choline dehydrogenase-like flavoprotein
VVCSAGAIHSPALLLRSGIDAPGVGDGLADHPSRLIEIAMKPDAAADPASSVTGAALRRGPVEIVALNHLGAARAGRAALLVGLLRTARRGSVRLDPAHADDPEAAPRVDFGRLDHPGDARALTDGVELAKRLLLAPSFDAIIDGFELGAGFGGYAHASSSCRMGVVVDERGAVAGYEGLYVCDASVFPEIPSAGTYLPTVLLAERLAAMWKT